MITSYLDHGHGKGLSSTCIWFKNLVTSIAQNRMEIKQKDPKDIQKPYLMFQLDTKNEKMVRKIGYNTLCDASKFLHEWGLLVTLYVSWHGENVEAHASALYYIWCTLLQKHFSNREIAHIEHVTTYNRWYSLPFEPFCLHMT